MAMENCKIVFSLCLFAFIATVNAASTVKLPVANVPRVPASSYLTPSYYFKTCPNLEGIIQQKMSAWFKKDYTLAAAIIRLHFHDCAVRGCDASILLNNPGGERTAEVSRTLRGFTLIDEIKAEVEKQCPKIVSCADILTAASRDATVLFGGPFWEVSFGRKDGKISLAKEANMVPQGYENVTSLINYFQNLGLSFVDLVVLSGAHTIGRTSCYSIRQRLYNFQGTGKPDPSLNYAYLNLLKKRCGSDTNYVNLDLTTPRTFDIAYYKNLGKKLGTLFTDQELYSDVRTGSVVSTMATQPEFFMGQFISSMVNLGNVNVLVGKNQGEIRLNCNKVNY